MFQLNDDFLQSVGLGGMPDDQKQPFLEHLYTALEERVGARLAEGLSEEQFTAFETLVNNRDDKGAVKWLEVNRPDYQQIVGEELEKLRQEVLVNRDRILGIESNQAAV